MKYGLIGEHLSHSFSPVIHGMLADYKYELREIAPEDTDAFFRKADFIGINVTIPYKQTVIPYLDFIDEGARAIGAVNTVVKRDGRLYGYNTDFYGMTMLFAHAGVDPKGKKAAILGSGATSKTAAAVLASLGAGEILRVSRSGNDGALTYGELTEKHSDTEIIVNTTPVGMYPDIYGLSLDISAFPALSGVIDAVYNPLRTPLVSDALARGIKAEGGLYMLVAQGVRASEIFLDKEYPGGTLDRIYGNILRRKENIVLIGMPASGKTTVGRLLKNRLGRELLDTDSLIEEKTGMKIPEIFEKYGEAEFRRLETEVIKEVSRGNSCIIATGGGAILREENVRALKQNGRLFFLDRPLEMLVPTKSRPLSSDREAIKKRFEERYDIYCSVCDVRIEANRSPRHTTDVITEIL